MLLVIGLLVAGPSFVFLYPLDDNIQLLTSNFFENLRGNPSLTFDANPKQFIDHQIENYVNLVTHHERMFNKKKRSLLDDFIQDVKGVYLLSGVRSIGEVPAQFPEDITLFEMDATWFAAALTSPGPTEKTDALVVFEHRNDSFIEISRVRVVNGEKLSTFSTHDFTVIAVAEYDSPKNSFHNKSGIYQFDRVGGIAKIQSIDMHYASDVVIWKIHDEVFMSIAQFMSNQSANVSYEVESPIYKWKGKHFDLLHSLPSQGARKITPFTVDNSHFLALANSRNNVNRSKIYSDIYKYDYHAEKFELYQRILTSGCRDMEVFHLVENNRKQDTFLVVANSYETGMDGNVNQDADSIVYKFVDDYFIPVQTLQVNGVTQWLPVQGFNNEFVLIASTQFDGLKFFQYDGWTFRETFQKSIHGSSSISSIRFSTFKDASTLVVSDKNSNGYLNNLFRLDFTYQNTLSNIYSEMMTWCESGAEKIENLSNIEIVGRMQRADIDEEVDQNDTVEISSRISSLETILNQLNSGFDGISTDVIIFKNTTTIHDLNAIEINDFQINEMLENVLDVNEGFELKEVSFETVQIRDSLLPGMINGHDSKSLVHMNDNLTLDSLIIEDTITTPAGIVIGGKLNGMRVDERNILLRDGDQNFSWPLTINDVVIKTMSTPSLNGRTFSTLQSEEEEPRNIDYIHNLTVIDLTIGGYINDVDLPTLDKYALRRSGNQTITSTYSFDHLQGSNLKVTGHLSNKKVTDLIPTDIGNFTIDQDLIFQNKLSIRDLQILNNINGIGIDDDGKMDILFKDSPEELEISGVKSFDEVIIHHAIYLQGHINSTNLEKMNPVVTTNEQIVIDGSRTITGQVIVEKVVSASDVVTHDAAFSLTKLQKHGLRLDAKEIKPHLQFVQQINVEDIFVDTINGREPEDFVVTGSEDTQIIMGVKTLLGDLEISGATQAAKINDVDVEELENNVMTVDGDQTVVGKHHLKDAKMERISVSKIVFNNETIDYNRDSGNVTIEEDLQIKSLRSNTVNTGGFVNGFDFDQIVNDTVQKDSDSTIRGHTFFQKVTVDDLVAAEGLEIDSQWDETNEITIGGPLNVKNTLQIKNLNFENDFNGIGRDSFGSDETDADGTTVVEGNYTFDRITVYGDTFIESNRINNVNITDLVENSVKIDEPFDFDCVTFESGVASKEPIILNGQIENFDFENTLPSRSDLDIEIFGEKTFNNLTINGSFNLEFVNGLNISQFCQFVMGKLEMKNVTVLGDAVFIKGPDLFQLNGISVNKIKENAWFGNRNTVLSGSIGFEDVIFKTDFTVGGFVDNISLTLLYDNYFSKTKDQNISATFAFGDLIFEDFISVPEISLNGEVNSINLNEFVQTVLLYDYDQVFEASVFLESCTISNLRGEFQVNGLNLEKDVMRYNEMNLVTGSKTFQNLNIEYLKLDKNIKIQNVDVLDWFKNVVLKTTSYNITGTKTFTNATFRNGFEMMGSLNQIPTFDLKSVMVKDIPQDITGRKTIHSSRQNPIFFKGVKLKGLLNQVDVSNMINNEAYKNQNNVFKTNISLHNNITTHNLVIRKTFRGVNITELMSNITNLGALNNLVEEYQKLLGMSRKLEESLKRQAYFLHHYKLVQTIPLTGQQTSRRILCPDGVYRVGILDRLTSEMRLFGWHDLQHQFLDDGANIKFDFDDLSYLDQVMMGRYIYTERNDGHGYFTQMMDSTKTLIIPTNTTLSTTSFVLPSGQTCTLFCYHKCSAKIYCDTGNEFQLLQSLDFSAYKAATITIEDALHLIVIVERKQGTHPHIISLKFNNQTSQFGLHQLMFEAHPTSVAAASYNGFDYLAIASGHLQDAIFSGSVEIRRFDRARRAFLPWQSLQLDAPVQVEFAVLPSNELVLYVVTDNPTEPLLVFRYEGVAGFKLGVTGSTLPEISYLNQFMGGAGRHFIVAQNREEINIIEAIFKGEKIE